MDDNFNTPIKPEGVTEAPSVQPQSAAPMGTNPAQNAPFYPNQPTFNSNYQPVAPNTGFNNYPHPNIPPQNNQPAPKKKKKTGKSVFAILLCICIVVASVAIGISFKGGIGGVGEENSKPADTNTTNNDAAAPNIEDSPVDYSEYSGEGIMTPEQIYDYVKNINVAIIVYSQNQKIGEALLTFAVHRCGIQHLWALEKNTRAISFYARHDFLQNSEWQYEEGTTERLLKLVHNAEIKP